MFEDADVGHCVLLVRLCYGDDDVLVSNLEAGGARLAAGQTVEF